MKHVAVSLVLVVALATSRVAVGVPADGSYEADRKPDRAVPAWLPGDGINWQSDPPSLIQWTVAKDGLLVQKPGAPKYVGMHLSPTPLTNVSYTVETRFRITQCDRGKKEYRSMPLTFHFSKRGAGYSSFNVGRLKREFGFLACSLSLKDEWHEQVRDDSLIEGKWLTVRLCIETGLGNMTSRLYLNGELVQEVETAQQSQRPDYFFVNSGGVDDAWEIDYIRWKNEVIPIGTPLERAPTPRERAAAEEELMRQRLEELLDER